uniref:Unannotated protein n=1 Tax=freshwater metagenome TaxID=449393 RepID=A0A6J7PWB7_9ZZZZ
MPIPKVASAASKPTNFTKSSSLFGMNIMTRTPARGRNTPTLSTQF